MSEWNFDEISWNFLRFEWDCCENFWEEWDLMRFECDDRASLLDSWMGMGFLLDLNGMINGMLFCWIVSETKPY